MSGHSKQTGFYRLLVAIETDATRYYGADARRPAVLNAADAEQMLAHIAGKDARAPPEELPSCRAPPQASLV